MLQEALFSQWSPSKMPRSIGHPPEDKPLLGQHILDDNRHGRHRGTILQTQTHFQQTGSPAPSPPGQVDFEDKQWQGSVNVGMARPVRRENTPVTGEAEEDGWLNSAMEDLADCPAVAVEEELDKPSGLGLSKSEAVLRGISGFVEEQPDIYPMEGGGIVIDLRSPDRQSSVLMVVECDGAGVLFYRASGKKGRARVDDAADVPNLLKALGLSTAKAMENR